MSRSGTGEIMGTREGMEHVQERPHVQLSISHTHTNIPTCGVFIHKQVHLPGILWQH